MADSVLLVLFNDFLSFIRFISRSCVYYEFDLALHFDEELVPVRLSLDEFNVVSYQFH